MKKHNMHLLLTAGVLIAACNRQYTDIASPDATGKTTAVAVAGTLPPVETNPPNTNYPPAFAGQTRIGGVKTSTPYTSTIVTQSLVSPWGMAELPDGRLLVTQKGGTMKVVSAKGAVSPDITGIPAVNSSGQGGLLGVALDPQFSRNRMIYWTFSENVSGGTLTSVAKGKLILKENRVDGATVIYRATPAYNGNLHYGGRILFDRTGNIVISTGERSDLATRPQAQYLTSSLGKTIRINRLGKAAPGNPFIGRSDARPELYSYGHRNPQGLAINPATGDLWEGELGPRGGDEVNRIQAGANYGWPTITYGIEYSGEPVGAGIQQQAGMEQPVYYWDPVISPSGMTFYNSNVIPEWTNNLFLAALSGTHICRLVIENNTVTGEERLLQSEGQRFRDVLSARNGSLYAITDAGRLYKISKK